MCGIAGVVHLDSQPATAEADGPFLQAAARRLEHRGPDDESYYYWHTVGLAFRRLSIVDVEGGRQPLANSDGSVIHITNGEIYNHRELRSRFLGDTDLGSHSDCAVIPYLYEKLGLDYLTEINGMFATALLDQRRRKLFLARDRLGIKPLYYFTDGQRLVFASEIKALLAHEAVPRRLDWVAALSQTQRRCEPDPEGPLTSFFEGIEHLQGGRVLEIDLNNGKLRERSYWDFEALPRGAQASSRPRGDYVDEYASLLSDSVRLRLMADVEYGLFLSGGIDSVAVARLASRHTKSFHTFSVLSQSTITNGDARMAHEAAKRFGLPNHQVLFDWRDLEVTPDAWRRILWACETPETGAEQLYKYALHGFARSQRPGLKVMLLGQGSDEFNGGYTNSRRGDTLSAERSWEENESRLRYAELQALRRRSTVWTAYDGLVPASELTGGQALPGPSRGVISASFLAGLAERPLLEPPWEVYRTLYRSSLQMYNLWHEDRTAASHSVENRVPFLDHRLVELTLSVPAELHSDLFWDKTILREAMSRVLPEEFARREKVPFFFGEDERYTRRLLYRLLRADGDALLHQGLEGARRAGGVFDESYFWRIVEELPSDPEYAAAEPLLQLVNMGILDQMAREEPRLPPSEPHVGEVRIDDWEAWLAEHKTALVKRDAELSLDSVPRFGESVLLTKCAGGDPEWVDEGGYYLLIDSQLRYVIEADQRQWIEFLLGIDGGRTVKQILDATQLDRGDIWKHLEEAVELGVVRISS